MDDENGEFVETAELEPGAGVTVVRMDIGDCEAARLAACRLRDDSKNGQRDTLLLDVAAPCMHCKCRPSGLYDQASLSYDARPSVRPSVSPVDYESTERDATYVAHAATDSCCTYC